MKRVYRKFRELSLEKESRLTTETEDKKDLRLMLSEYSRGGPFSFYSVINLSRTFSRKVQPYRCRCKEG